MELYHRQRKLDVVLLHAPFCWEGHCNAEQSKFLLTQGWYAAWRNLEQMHDEGLVAAIGVSNFQPNQLRELLSFANKRVAVVQNFMVRIRVIKSILFMIIFFLLRCRILSTKIEKCVLFARNEILLTWLIGTKHVHIFTCFCFIQFLP